MNTSNQPSLLWPHLQQRVVHAPSSPAPPDPAISLWAKKLSNQCDDMKSVLENAVEHTSHQQNETQEFLRQATAGWEQAALHREQKMSELDENLNENVHALRSACNSCYDTMRSTDVKLKLIDSLLTNLQNRMDVQDSKLQNIESMLQKSSHAHESQTQSRSATNSIPTYTNDTNAVEAKPVGSSLMEIENLSQARIPGVGRKKTKRRLVSRGTEDELCDV